MDYNFKDVTPEALAPGKDPYRDPSHIVPGQVHQISELAKFIREKMYGIDVREAMAQAFERIIETWIYQGMSEAEVIEARGKFAKLADRLADIETDLDTQVGEINAALQDISFSQINLNYGKITPGMISDELLQMIAGTAGINATVADGSITTAKLAKKAVTMSKLPDSIRKLMTIDVTELNWEAGRVLNGELVADSSMIRTNKIYLDGGATVWTDDSLVSFYLTKFNGDGSFDKNLSGYTRESEVEEAGDYIITLRKVVGGNYITLPQNPKTKEDTLKKVYISSLGIDGKFLNKSSVTKDALDQSLSDKIDSASIIKVGKNIFNVDDENKLVDIVVASDGSHNSNSNFVSYKIPTVYGKRYNIHSDVLTVYGFDRNGNSTENFNKTLQFRIENPNTAYFYLPVHKSLLDSAYCIEGDLVAGGDVPFGETKVEIDGLTHQSNDFYGMKHVALGTSLTFRNKVVSVISENLGTVLDNRGVGGGGITTSAGAGNTTMQEVDNLEDFKGLLTIDIGANDGNHPMGEWGDTTDDTWYGALYKLFEKVTQKTTARCVVIIMPPVYLNGDSTRKEPIDIWHGSSKTMWQVRRHNAIKEMAAIFGIPVIDAAENAGLGGYHQNSQTFIDHIHHSDLGGRIIGDYCSKQIANINAFPDELRLATK